MRVLGNHDAQSQVYLGYFIEYNIPRGYMSGGASYAISKPAVRAIVDEGSKFPDDCPKDGGVEDMDIGRYWAAQLLLIRCYLMHCRSKPDCRNCMIS